MKVFGSLCYATNTQPQTSKFDQRAYICVLLGYLISFKAYKLYNLDTRSICISRDVVFKEHNFPFHNPSDVDLDTNFPHIPVPQPYHEDTNNIVKVTIKPHMPYVNLSNSNHSNSTQRTDTTPSQTPTQPRRSTRQIPKSTWLNDFIASIQFASLNSLPSAIIPVSHVSLKPGMDLALHNFSFEPNYLSFVANVIPG